jgi:hypothetical protein
MSQEVATHQRHIHRVAPIAGTELAAQVDHGLGVVVIGNARVVLLQPLVKRFLGTMDGWHTGPKGIIQVKGNNSYLLEHGSRLQ